MKKLVLTFLALLFFAHVVEAGVRSSHYCRPTCKPHKCHCVAPYSEPGDNLFSNLIFSLGTGVMWGGCPDVVGYKGRVYEADGEGVGFLAARVTVPVERSWRLEGEVLRPFQERWNPQAKVGVWYSF